MAFVRLRFSSPIRKRMARRSRRTAEPPGVIRRNVLCDLENATQGRLKNMTQEKTSRSYDAMDCDCLLCSAPSRPASVVPASVVLREAPCERLVRQEMERRGRGV